MKMHTFCSRIFFPILLVFCLFFTESDWALSNGFVGYWRTYDNHSRPRSIVKMVQEKNYYVAHIAKTFSSGPNQERVCQKCVGVLHNRPMLGLPILWIRIKQQNPNLMHCHVLNPDSGKFYNCQISLVKNGTVLKLHPYVGSPLFGVTVYWLRTQLK